MQAQDGSEVSTLEIKTILSDEVSREDKTKPLSDERLMDQRTANLVEQWDRLLSEPLDVRIFSTVNYSRCSSADFFNESVFVDF